VDQRIDTNLAARRGVAAGFLAVIERSHALASMALIILSLLMFLPGFVGMPPMDRDEPRFAQASKQMLETGDFVSIRFQDEARNKKPVGIYWLQNASVAVAQALGFPQARATIWLYRIPSLIGAVAAVLLTYWAGLVWLERRYALFAAALFAATILIGVEARLAKTDAVLTATVVAAMGALARIWAARDEPARNSSTTPFILWGAIAVGALIKGPITLMIVALACVALVATQRSARWLKPGVDWRAVILAVAIILPWFIAIAVATHGAFFSDAVGGDMLGKVAGAREAHGAPPGSYLAAALVTLWPITPFAIIAVPAIWRERGRDAAVTFLLAWLVPSWLLFEALPTKLPHYVLPLYPAIALLVALAAQKQSLFPDRRWKQVAMLLLPLIPIAVAIAIPFATLFYADRASILGALVAAVGAVFAIAAAIAAIRKRPLAAVATTILAALTLAFGAYEFGILRLRGLMISPRLVEALAMAPCSPVAFATVGYNEPSLVFLTRTGLQMLDAKSAASFLVKPGCRAAFVDIRDEAEFTQALAALQQSPHRIGHVLGVNLNGGRHMDIGVYINGG
jgi:4-amino-4-deoxy-L-arabinose transferase-like glycosyltransferase